MNERIIDNTDCDCMDILIFGSDYDLTQLYKEVFDETD